MVKPEAQPLQISWRWLLAVYLIVPVLLLVVIIDRIWFSESLLPYMGLSSLLLPLYLLLFELPHIIASLLGFADREYRQQYARPLYLGLPAVLLGVYLLFRIDPVWAILAYLVATMYHVIKQQTGIAFIFGTPRGIVHQVWTYAAIVCTGTIYSAILLAEQFPIAVGPGLYGFIYAALALSLMAGMVQWYRTSRSVGAWYVIATTMMLASSFWMLYVGYLFFAFFAIRFVHDVTAFIFYTAHEHNRNHAVRSNPIYRIFAPIPLPIFVLVPLISIGLAYLIRSAATGSVALWMVVIALGFAHYYLESLMWKRDSLHRQHIRIDQPV